MIFSKISILEILKRHDITHNCHGKIGVPRFTGKTQITGKNAKIPERPKNNRELNFAILYVYAYFLRLKVFCMFISNIIVLF